MSDGKSSKASTIAVVALVALNLAACEPGANPHGEKRIRAGLHPEPSMLLPTMRPYAIREQLHVASGRVWVLHTDGVHVHDPRGSGEAISIHLPGWSWATEPWACPPDLALVGDRDVLVTSNVTPAIWRIDPATLEVTRHDLTVAENAGREVGFSRLRYSARYDTFFAAGALDNTLWRIDRTLTLAQPVALSPPLPQGCVLAVIPGDADSALCLRIEHGDWIMTLSADRRSGEAHPGKCSSKRPRVDIDVEAPTPAAASLDGRRHIELEADRAAGQAQSAFGPRQTA